MSRAVMTWMELWQNDFLLGLDLCVFILFGLFILKRHRSGWHHSAASQVAAALVIIYAGKFWDRGTFWMVSNDLIAARWGTMMRFIGLAAAVWGTFCLLRIFAGVLWGRWAWAWCTGLSLLIALLLS